MSEVEVVDQFADPRWRLANLYEIIDDSGNAIKFVPNEMQMLFWESMWYRNVILKGRQHGFCLHPLTRILTADLRWVYLRDVRIGDRLVAVDEHSDRKARRRMRTAVVEGIGKRMLPTYEIHVDDGRRVHCSAQHPWLSRTTKCNVDWRAIQSPTKKKLRVGDYIRWITRGWNESDLDDAWMGGVIDGEGSLDMRRPRVAVNQADGPVLERIREYLEIHGYHVIDKIRRKAVHAPTVSRMDEVFRLLGTTRPTRFIGKEWWVGKELCDYPEEGWAQIMAITPVGDYKLIDLQTSTGTFIADGFVSHNTTFIGLFMLDAAVFYPNQTCGIVAHTLDDVKKIFRRKIRHPYEHLPAGIREITRPTNDTQNELIFANGSEISVDTGFRGGTYNYLHISEYGKISSNAPEKAAEIKTGSFNTVHPGNYIFVESTGHGKGGEFYELCKSARDLQSSGRRLTQLDFLYHFYPWWMNAKYRLSDDDAREVVFTTKDQDYFKRVKRTIDKRLVTYGSTIPWLRAWAAQGSDLTFNQRAWYIKTRQWNGDEMKREFPSHDEEPFEAVLRGAYFAQQMQEARDQGRITRVPHERGLAVDTWWDLGLRDKMAIWFLQTLGREVRFIDYWEDSDRAMEEVLRTTVHGKALGNGWHYRHHVGPHDLAVRDMMTKKSRWEMALKLGFKFVVGEQYNQDDQVEAGRNLIASSWFDEEKCSEGIAHLEQFRKEWNDHLGSYMDKWRHDEHSHGASAFMNGAMMLGRLQTGTPKARPVQTKKWA